MFSPDWKAIKGFRGVYQISRNGEVRSLVGNNGKYKTPRVLKLREDVNGYLRVSLFLNGKEKRYMVHRLVAGAFIEREEKLNIVNHKDSDRKNNSVENLEWCTQSQNILHGYRNGKACKKGEKNSMSILCEKQVRVIKHILLIPNRISVSKIAEIFKVNYSVISNIKTGKNWNFVSI